MSSETESQTNHLFFGKSFLEKGQVSVWLDGYDDLFSDFDPRPYSKRTLSDDFIIQVRRISKDQLQEVRSLHLLLPDNERNMSTEAVIANRIHDSFNHFYQQLLLENRKIKHNAIKFTVSGIILMVTASYLSFNDPKIYVTFLLLTLFEPAGWFLFWFGLDQLLQGRDKRKKELNFYAAFASASIEFGKY